MYLVVGLGNPEPEYSYTRHNMGFSTINELAKNNNIQVNKSKFQGLYGMGTINNEKVILLKPQTYMNLSGKSIREAIDFYKIDLDKIIVIYDDLDIEEGIIKIRKKGGAGTHNGMKSVISELHTQEFSRIRIGIGNPKKQIDLADYVLEKVQKKDYEILQSAIINASKAVEDIIKIGTDNAMNKYN